MNYQLKNQQIPNSLEDLGKILLVNRNINKKNEFFHPPHPDTFSLTDLKIKQSEINKAIKLIKQTQKNQSKIIIFGDYDADGICATAIMWETLNKLGIKATPFIPHRQKHGYGLSMAAIKEILENNKPSLIITVDNGIVANKEIEFLKKNKVKVILTDHHSPNKNLPEADALIHSTKLCGASVAWVFSKNILEKFNFNKKIFINNLLDLAGIATIADQVPLIDANRSFAYFGIQALRVTKRPGLLALFEISQINQIEIDSYHIGFLIAPRINAMGRLEHGLDALRLLCQRSKPNAKKLAQKLDEVNTRRQDATLEALELVKTQAKIWQDEHLIIVSSENYHEGIIGLIAGKLVDEYAKPSIAISINEKLVKGSARSVKGVNITDFLRLVETELKSVGGHPLAAGFSAKTNKLSEITQKLQDLAREKISKNLLVKTTKLECQLDQNLLTLETLKLINKFAPFGSANPKPKFLIKNLKILDFKTVGRNQNHLSLTLKIKNKIIKAVAWNLGELANKLEINQEINLATSLEANTWKNKTSLQLVVREIELG